MRLSLNCTLTLAALCLVAHATLADEKPADKKAAVKKAPAFKLKDQRGKLRSLQEFTKKGPVALVFYRSADW